MGVNALIGRALTANDFEPGAGTSIVISYNLWQRMFGGDSGVIGRSIRTTEGDLMTIVGVMPEGFQHPDKLRDAWGRSL
jgi:hypothetical protein